MNPSIFDRRRFVKTVLLVLVVTALIAYGNGYFDVKFGKKAGAVAVDRRPLGDVFDVRIEDAPRGYDVVFRRGSGFPKNAAEKAALVTLAASAADPAVAREVASCGRIRVALLNDDRETLVSTAVDLSPLADPGFPELAVRLPKKWRGATITFARDSGGNE